MPAIEEKIALGTVYGDHSEVESAVSALTDQRLGHVPVVGLDGPNDLVQILASVDGWKLIGVSILSIYGSGIVSEAGKDTWKAIAPKIKTAPAALQAKFLQLVHSLQKEQANGQDVSIGLIEPTFDSHGRRDRVYIKDLSPEELARHLYIFSHCVHPVSSWLSEVYAAQTQKGEVFVSMHITDEGTLVVELEPGYGKTSLPLGVSKKVFNAQGTIIEEKRNS